MVEAEEEEDGEVAVGFLLLGRTVGELVSGEKRERDGRAAAIAEGDKGVFFPGFSCKAAPEEA